ncbi:riboflavin biosynthesis protein RibF [Candidatus Legionella polyplacis]|uniref:Riboflavin biosynthesis protein n=1 Tax=Candidatus Legionella polyplacis TaxID=2005262 RepID=A0ABZ2GY98_9GAMM
MRLLRDNKNSCLFFLNGSAVTIGNFDGVHLGHQALLKKFCIESEKMKLPTVVLIFEPQSNEYFKNSNKEFYRLTNLREKLCLLKNFNINYVLCLRFNKYLACMSAIQFLRIYFFSFLNVKYLLVGKDFKFGYKRIGDINLLKNNSKNGKIIIQIFPEFLKFNKRISSTYIRRLLYNGKFKEASKFLGRYYSILGKVVKGSGDVKITGIPTANLSVKGLNLIPIRGVFIVRAEREKGNWLIGVANFGKNPTFNRKQIKLEIYFLNFNDNLYNEKLRIFFIKKIRDEVRFLSIRDLTIQIYHDIKNIKFNFGVDYIYDKKI